MKSEAKKKKIGRKISGKRGAGATWKLRKNALKSIKEKKKSFRKKPISNEWQKVRGDLGTKRRTRKSRTKQSENLLTINLSGAMTTGFS